MNPARSKTKGNMKKSEQVHKIILLYAPALCSMRDAQRSN
ncbi:unnamed protein product [Prunus brigantina]